MTHDQTTPAPVEVTLKPCPFCGGEASDSGHIRYGKPLTDVWWGDDNTPITEAFYCNCMKCGAVSHSGIVGGYRTKAEAIAAWNARHSAPAGEVTQADRATRTARFLADQKAAAAALASLPDSTRARLEAWQTAQSEWFDGTVLEIVAEFIAFENTRHSAPAGEVDEAELLRALSRIEDKAATILAARGLACTEEGAKRVLRSNYLLARTRADVFMQMAMEAENVSSN